MDLVTGGGSIDKIQLEMVTDLEGNMIYEGNGTWPVRWWPQGTVSFEVSQSYFTKATVSHPP